MDSYISSELIAKLREQQRTLRRTLQALEASLTSPDLATVVDHCRRVSALYQSHERLVGALLEAVEPDNPLPHSQGMR